MRTDDAHVLERECALDRQFSDARSLGHNAELMPTRPLAALIAALGANCHH